MVEHLDSLDEHERGYSGDTAVLEEAAAVLRSSWDSRHNQSIDSQALRAEVSTKPVWASFFFNEMHQFFFSLILLCFGLLAGGAVAPSAGGSHRSSGRKPGVEEPLHPGSAEGAGHPGRVAESAAEHGAHPTLQHLQEDGRPPAIGGSPITRQILQQGESRAEQRKR